MRIADAIEKGVEIERLVGVAAPASSMATSAVRRAACRRQGSGSRWRRTAPSPSSIRTSSPAGGAAGAEIAPFSPLADEAPDAAADAVWLPGGYPELHAGVLAAASAVSRRACRPRRARRADPRRVRRLHGARRGARGRGRRTPCDGGAARRRDVVQAAQAAPRLPARAAARGFGAGSRRDRTLRARVSLCLAGRGQRRAACCDRGRERTAAAPESGSRRGSVTGTFFHVIDRAA